MTPWASSLYSLDVQSTHLEIFLRILALVCTSYTIMIINSVHYAPITTNDQQFIPLTGYISNTFQLTESRWEVVEDSEFGLTAAGEMACVRTWLPWPQRKSHSRCSWKTEDMRDTWNWHIWWLTTWNRLSLPVAAWRNDRSWLCVPVIITPVLVSQKCIMLYAVFFVTASHR